MNKINIRDASEVDAPIIADLIYATEDNPEHVWGHGTKEETLARIEWLVKNKDSRYSYTNIKVAELDGKPCGAIILLRSEDILKLDIKTSLKLLYLIKGTKRKISFLLDIIKGFGLDEAEENELYIANLATSEEVRGKGIGKDLMKCAEKTAKEQGYKVCSLLAKDKNISRFYEKLDYIIEKEERYFSHSLYRMIKAV